MKMVGQNIFSLLFLSSLYLTAVRAGTCKSGAVVWQNSCLYYNTTELAFVVAERYCLDIGGHLVSIHDGMTNGFIGQKAGQIFQNWYDFWIGGNTLISGGGSNWAWTDGSDFDFSSWTTGEPDNADKQCMTASTSDGYWSTEDCAKKRPFVCSVSSIVSTPSPTTPPPPPPTSTTTVKPQPQYRNCSFGWVYFEPTNSCYGYNNKGVMMNWTAAETYCNSQGAHLASIHSFEEQSFINEFGLVSWKSVWLGLYSVDLGITWQWTDGSPFDYIYWYNHQKPQIYFGGQNCALLESSVSSSGYQTNPCATSWYPICKKPYRA